MKDSGPCAYIVCQEERAYGSHLCKEHYHDWDNAIALLEFWTDSPLFTGCGASGLALLEVRWSSVIDFYYEYGSGEKHD